MSLDFDIGAPVVALRSQLRGLVKQHVPEDFLGESSGYAADMEARISPRP